MQISFQTDVGKKRNSNQDYVAIFKNKAGITLAILADGMGGHQAGDVASKMAVEGMGEKWQETTLTSPEKACSWFVAAIQNANEAVYNLGQEKIELQGMGTTIVCVAVFEEEFALAHVGDSRMYLVRDHEITQLTEDHSLVNELVRSGEITKEMAATHPRRNVLTRSVGMPGSVEVDIASHFYKAGDYLLLASDGLTNMLADDVIKWIIDEPITLDEKVAKLISGANDAGGADNITVLLIEIGGSAHD
ncbi:Stp1/IreP family PP2C-type Ser/Thr phosphatase [Enterococcus sp. MJM12]|uniref:Stp1/IreP family PP2C-type Ser/Thr phosphatase n=1 Tax=Candidatus Enterococcus myersii TaxID=2815322 RepID=A0ABS3H4H5_9ENTE|nr:MULTISPECIES: Stp1/IreP family PP2C-type Ser/Thr phosphatase [Enterococcus]MBO0448357.1 Stp1/IreP family PP2C-type Ser/Thr phosphatase [Enterococcus sp. MJM12]MCD1024289.1 Stp1/IreP family PP2C-type Ser/Thr phosphatase [Enterococcus sp. SMC-9]WHA09061.1 Stp1/IreP family PP2C-type Ser/Thr phosphatase [Enterococcus montenegrensis]